MPHPERERRRALLFEFSQNISASLLFILFILSWFTDEDFSPLRKVIVLLVLVSPSISGVMKMVKGEAGVRVRLFTAASFILFLEGVVQMTGYRASPLFPFTLLALAPFPLFFPFFESLLIPSSFLVMRIIPLCLTSPEKTPLHLPLVDLVSTMAVLLLISIIILRVRRGIFRVSLDMSRIRKGAHDLKKGIVPEKYHYTGGTFDERQEERLLRDADLIGDGIRVFTELGVHLFSPNTCAVYRIEEGGSMFLVSGVSREEGEPLQEADSTRGFVKILHDRESPFLWNGVPKEGRATYYRKDPGIGSLMLFPLKRGGNLWGVLIIDSLNESAFGSQGLEKGEKVAKLVETFISGAQDAFRYREVYEEAKALSLFSMKLAETLDLERITDLLLLNMSTLLRFDSGFVIDYDEEREEGTIVNAVGEGADEYRGKNMVKGKGGGLIGEVLEKRLEVKRGGLKGNLPSFFGRGHRNLRNVGAFLLLPMKVGDMTVGAILLTRRGDTPFSDMEARRVSIIANQAALSIRNSKAYIREKELAITDGLTGLYNHRYFQELVEKEVERARRKGEIFTLVMMDIDFFKRINDTYGHPTGDRVLKRIGEILRSTLRGGIDIAARYGGEEFSLALGEAGEEEAMRIVERIRERVSEEVFLSPDEGTGGYVKFSITVSAGMAVYPFHAQAREGLISRADEALYRAKGEGRDRVVVSD